MLTKEKPTVTTDRKTYLDEMKLGLGIIRKGWLLVFPLFICSNTYSQSIRHSSFYDHPNAGAGILEDMVLLDNDELLLIGNSLNINSGYRDGHHVLVDDFGNLITEVDISSDLVEFNPQAILQSNFSNGVYSAGYHCDYSIESPGPCDFYFSKLDHLGDTIFTKIVERRDTSDLLLNMVQSTANSILLIGWTYNNPNETDADILITVVDTFGNVLNNVVYGGVGTDFLNDGIAVDSTGDVIMAGYTTSFPVASSSIRTWVVKTDSIGNVKWHRTYNGPVGNRSSVARVTRSNTGTLFLVGGNETFGSGGFGVDGTLLQIDTAGNEIWSREYEVQGGQGLWGVEQLSDGSIVSCGVTDGPSGSQAGWLIKTDENGDTLWTRTYDESSGTDYLRNMMVMDNGDIVMVGFGIGENSLSQDGWILRVDSMGCVVENCHITGVNDELGIKNDKLRIYPNPVQDFLNIELKTGSVVGVELYNSVGALVFSDNEKAFQTRQLDLSGFGRGVYLLKIETDQGVHSTKVVLE